VRHRYARGRRSADVEDLITHEGITSEPGRSHVRPAAASRSGPHREGEEPKPMMHEHGKSDPAIVATKPTNKAGRPAAEPVERRAGTEGNAGQRCTRWAQDRESVFPNAEPHTASRKAKEEGTVHLAPPPCRHRPAPYGVLRAQAKRCTRRGRADMAGLRGRARAQARRSARTGPAGGVSGAAIPATVHTEAGWQATPARGRHTPIELHFAPVSLWARLKLRIRFIHCGASGLSS
jgi:hypothetical protein